MPAYRTVKSSSDGEGLKQPLQERKIDLVTFTSSSTATYFVEVLEKEDLKGFLEGVRVACIGPIAGETAERFGLTVDIMPQEYTIRALAEAIIEYGRA